MPLTKTNIAYDDVSDREPALLMLPGWCASRSVFRPLYAHLDNRALAVDWRGHGGSGAASGDFGTAELVEDALAVVAASGARQIVPVATAHAGWVAIALRERLGAERVPAIVLVDWMVLGAPPPFRGALEALANPETAAATRDKLFAMWTTGVDDRRIHDFVAAMGRYNLAMWQRAAREIAAGFDANPVPVAVLDRLACRTLHLYAQPADPAFLDAQTQYAAAHPWFSVRRVAAKSHFPTLEAAGEMAAAINAFVR
jgi:pimeloyl-ACP methyl ester carboxylesterase